MDLHPATRAARRADELLAAAPAVTLPDDITSTWQQPTSLLRAPALELTPDELAALACSFAWCRRAERSVADGEVTGRSRLRVERELEARRDHLGILLAGVHRLIRQIVAEKVVARYGNRWGETLMEDVLAEAYAVAIDAAAGYDPSRGTPFAPYVAQRIRGAVGDAAFRYAASGTMNTSWQRLGRISAAVEHALQAELQRPPTDAELQAAVEAETRRWADDRIPDEVTGDEREEAIRAKLVKQGTAGALADLPEIRRISSGEVSLDLPVGDGSENGTTLASFVAPTAGSDQQVEQDSDVARLHAVLRLALAGMDPELASRVVSRLEGDDSDGRGTAAVAVRGLRTRLAGPHLQYAALAPHLDAPIPEMPEHTDSWDAVASQLLAAP